MTGYDWITLSAGLFLSYIIWLVYNETKSKQVLNYIPSIWTSLGILFTFVSIVIALKQLDTSKSGESEIISKLIKDIAPAFSTSIIGIIGSVLSSIWIKINYANEELKESGLIPIDVTPERSLYDINKNIINMNLGLTNMLNDIKTNQQEAAENDRLLTDKLITTLNQQSSILKTFVDEFVSSMNNVFDDLRVALNKEIVTYGSEQFEKSAALIEYFNKQIQERSLNLMELQSESMAKYFNSSNSKMNEITTTLVNAIDENNSKALNKFDEIINHQQSTLQDWSQSNRAQMVEMNNGFSAAFSSITERQIQSLSQMSELGSSYQKLTEDVYQKAVSTNSEAIATLSQQIQDYSISIKEELTNFSGQINQALSQNLNQLTNSYDYLKVHLAQLIANYEQSTEAYSDAVQNAHDLNTSVEKCVSLIDKSINNNSSTNEQLSVLISNVEEKYINIENLIFKIKEIHDVIDVLSQLETHLNKLVKYEKTI